MSAPDVLVVTPSLGRGGAERHAVLLATTVDRARWAPHVLTLADGPLHEELDAAGVPVRVIGTGRGIRSLPAAATAVRAAIEEIEPAMLSAHDVVGELAARAAVRQRPRPLLVWKHTYGHIGHRGVRDRAIERLSHRLVTRYGAVCHSQVRYLVDELGIDAARIRVVANSVPLADATKVRPGDPPLVVMVAAMRGDKGHASALAAWRRVVDVHADARLGLIGDGPLRTDLVRLVASLGLHRNVDFLGEIARPAQLVARAHALLLASYSIECFPYAALEAMALGTPVITTDVGGLPELVDDHITGLLVPPHDSGALSRAILAVLADPAVGERMGCAGRDRLARAFPFDAWRAQIADLLDETANVPTRATRGSNRVSRRTRLPALTATRITATMLVLAIVGAGLGFVLSRAQSVSWQANRHALIRIWSVDALVLSGQTADVTANNLADATTVVTSMDVLTRAAAALGNGTDRSMLADAVTATASADSDFVDISATGASAAQADQRVQAVAGAFVAVVRTKVLASAAQISALTAGGTTSSTRAEIQVRAQAVAALDPVQIYSTGEPARDGTSTTMSIAVGVVVGLALGALVIVLLTFAAPRLRRPGDVANSLGLPAMSWTGDEDATDAHDGIGADLVRLAARGAIAVCPARPEDAAAAVRFGTWLSEASDGPRQPHPRRSPFSGVVHIGSPVEGLATSRPPADAIDTAVLVTTVGSQTDVVERAADLLGQWRRMDVVILVR